MRWPRFEERCSSSKSSRVRAARPGTISTTSTDVHLLHGKLDVSLVSNPATPPVQLESLQTVSVSSHALGMVRPLTPDAVSAVTSSLKPRQASLPGPSEKFL